MWYHKEANELGSKILAVVVVVSVVLRVLFWLWDWVLKVF